MRVHTCLKLGSAIGLIALLSACGSSGTPTGASRPAPPTSFESQFGSAFAALFDASPTSQPATPTSASVPPLQPAAQPQSPPTTTAPA
ncbi:hypothetical protein [Novosphingobium sp.]|uniref:hypothetical protein n=1 Tax=Novosphingobium sp. TaxID=1874826 RepID=UPI003D0A0C74